MSNVEKITELKAELKLAEIATRVAGEFDCVTGVDKADYIIEQLFDCDKAELIKSLESFENISYNNMEEIVSGIKDDIIALI